MGGRNLTYDSVKLILKKIQIAYLKKNYFYNCIPACIIKYKNEKNLSTYLNRLFNGQRGI